MAHLQCGQGVLGTACLCPTCCQLGIWTGGPRMAHSHGWHVGTGRSARAEGWERRFLSTWPPPPHGWLWLLRGMVASFQEQASQETGSGSCQHLKARARYWHSTSCTLFICQIVTGPDLRDGETCQGEVGSKNLEAMFSNRHRGAQTRSLLGGGCLQAKLFTASWHSQRMGGMRSL